MGKKWKIFGIIILVTTGLLVLFDLTVLIAEQIHSNRRWEVLQEAEDKGYPEDYAVCSRQGSIMIDGREYLAFNAHRHAFLDGCYDEDLLVLKEDSFEDRVPDKKEGLEIFAKEIRRITDNEEQNYTLIDVYRIDKCWSNLWDDLFWMGLAITIVVLPVVCVSGIIWLIRFFVYKYKAKKSNSMTKE